MLLVCVFIILTSAFRCESHYLRRLTPAVTIFRQNERLVVRRLFQSCQFERVRVYETVSIAAAGYVQFVPLTGHAVLKIEKLTIV